MITASRADRSEKSKIVQQQGGFMFLCWFLFVKAQKERESLDYETGVKNKFVS